MFSNLGFKDTSDSRTLLDYSRAMTLRADFARNLASIREERGLTQRVLADRAGLSVGTIRGYEQRVNWPEPERMELLARTLQTTVGELLRSKDEKTFEVKLDDRIAVQEAVMGLVKALGSVGFMPALPSKRKYWDSSDK